MEENQSKELQEELAPQEDRQQELAGKERALTEREQALTEKERELTERESALTPKEQALAKWEAALTKRERLTAEEEANITRRREQDEAAWQKELLQKRKEAYQVLSAECRKERARQGNEFAEELKKAQTEIDQLYQNAQAKHAAMLAEGLKKLEQARQTQDAALKAREDELKAREENLQKQQEELEKEQARVKLDQRQNKRGAERLKFQQDEEEARIESEVQERTEAAFQEKDAVLEDLRRQIRDLTSREEAVRNFESAYGSPQKLEEEKRRLVKERDEARTERDQRPTRDVQEKYESVKQEKAELEAQVKGLETENARLNSSQRDMNVLREENLTLKSDVDAKATRIASLEAGMEHLKQEIARLQGPSEKAASRDERVAAILNPSGFLPLEGEDLPGGREDKAWETRWLEEIRGNCRSYGIAFPRRILYAFHTALKISDWSIITVLSGVSGTGKSELPKLYAKFGGMNFFSVPVQPNWDSQESMLGFFNSIDNCFEPEELLRFLALCTKDPQHPENDCFSDYMSIVLLDEMNLAHVEHYFARFLSELERRRGMSKDALPSIEVKLGAGVEPYRLPLTRSILWTGTMNQDETTKSLSDKVLDRGQVIHFPRPTTLAGRLEMSDLNETIRRSGRKRMTREKWAEMVVWEICGPKGEQGEQIRRYKKIIEDINQLLEPVGRALGHRVWQSIEFYIFNYPTVRLHQQENGDMTEDLRRAMNDAFEDQLVQKVMPKLRGIETRGQGGKQLEAICALLESSGFSLLTEDFQLACRLGYGQFMWNSAKYIQEEEPSEPGGGA